jgi:hypothetical protein
LTTTNPGPSPFELAAAELRRLGLDLTRLPGEYSVNFHGASEATAQTAETVDEALDLGRAMAAERAEAHTRPCCTDGTHRRGDAETKFAGTDFYADDVNHFTTAPGRLAYADALPPRTPDDSQPGTRAQSRQNFVQGLGNGNT